MIVNITVFIIGALSMLGLEFIFGVVILGIVAERKSIRYDEKHSNNSDGNK